MKSRAVLNLDTYKDLLPPEGTAARLIIATGAAAPVRRGVDAGPDSDPLRPMTLAKPVAVRQVSLPFVRLPIPEPSASPAAVQLDTPLPDNDAPVRSVVPQTRIELPVKK
jgi:hypothetical protein